jgi:hypothetical protein
MGLMSRNKGKVGEREVAKLLQEFGYEGERGVQYKGGVDSPDVRGLPDWHIEVKRVEAFKLYPALAQANSEKAAHERSVVFHRKNNEDWVAVLSARDFLELVRGF